MVKYYRDCDGKVLCRHRGGCDQFYLGQGGVERIRFKKDFIEEMVFELSFINELVFQAEEHTSKKEGGMNRQVKIA